jgi:hypothetical protein
MANEVASDNYLAVTAASPARTDWALDAQGAVVFSVPQPDDSRAADALEVKPGRQPRADDTRASRIS